VIELFGRRLVEQGPQHRAQVWGQYCQSDSGATGARHEIATRPTGF
jgi:hypothetical protein